MKFFILIATVIFSAYSFAENTEDLSKVHQDSRCIPVRGNDGTISSYKCDGPLSEKVTNSKFEKMGLKKGDVIVSANGEPIDSTAKAMELYNSAKMNNTLIIQRPATTAEQIKSCLAGIYDTQMNFHKSKGTFTPVAEEFGLNRISMCNGLDVSADFANQNEFKFVAKAGDKTWSVDQTKTIEEIR